ncbi:MAG: RNA polymerase sigma factor [Candidatus Korobacteraceae bacterium]
MNVHISYKISKTPDLEKIINQQVEKLGRYLRVFRPELVHLKGVVEDTSAREGVVVSLNLRLPSGQMAAQESSATATAAIKAAFDAATEQLKKHKELLRSHHKWPRRGAPERAASVETVPFEHTVAVVKPETVSASDISSYVDANLIRLRSFIQRELDFRESEGQLRPGEIAVDDVVDEAIAGALSEQHDKPERIKVEPWLYRLARQAMDTLGKEGRGERPIVEENGVPDPTADTPEEMAARRELFSLVEMTLRSAGRDEREAFMLYTIEGFTLVEVADIMNRKVEEVRAFIRRAREHLQRDLPVNDPLKEKLVEYSSSA